MMKILYRISAEEYLYSQNQEPMTLSVYDLVKVTGSARGELSLGEAIKKAEKDMFYNTPRDAEVVLADSPVVMHTKLNSCEATILGTALVLKVKAEEPARKLVQKRDPSFTSNFSGGQRRR